METVRGREAMIRIQTMSAAGGGAGGGPDFSIDSTTSLFMKTNLPLFPTLRRLCQMDNFLLFRDMHSHVERRNEKKNLWLFML